MTHWISKKYPSLFKRIKGIVEESVTGVYRWVSSPWLYRTRRNFISRVSLCLRASACTSFQRPANCVSQPSTSTTQWPNRSLTTCTAAGSPSWTGEDACGDVEHVKCCDVWQHGPDCVELAYRLKQTTGVMLGGKQVVVCGYGEVSKHITASASFSWTTGTWPCFLSEGRQGLLCCPQSAGLHCLRDRNRSHLCSSGLVCVSWLSNGPGLFCSSTLIWFQVTLK